MSGLRVLSIAALTVGVVLLIATLAMPTCRNHRGTARDSGYPCKLQRSSGATEFIFDKDSQVSLPRGEVVALALGVLGLVGLLRTRAAG